MLRSKRWVNTQAHIETIFFYHKSNWRYRTPLNSIIFLDPEKVERVKELYEDLMLPHTYETYEEESYKIITTHIQQISRGLPHELFFKILEKIYRRNA